MRRLVTASLLAGLLTLSASAGAVETPNVGGEPILIDITNTSIFNYHFDNRNDFFDPTQLDDPTTRVDDFYGEWIDRLNVQASWWRLRLGIRIDAITFLGVPSRKDAKDLAYESVDTGLGDAATLHDKNDYANRYLRELNTRFQNTYYPAKLYVGYTQPGIDITVGDFYAQLGRGLVLSVRKLDEVAVDTTVRGIKAVLDRNFGPIHMGFTALAGQLNPLRIDEPIGRRLNGAGSPFFFGFPKAHDLITYQYDDTKNLGAVVKKTEPGTPNYYEDTVYGAHLEGGPSAVTVALNGSLLVRKGGEKTPTFSGSVSVPSIFDHGDLYVEVAGQDPSSETPGYAVYVNANARGGPITASLEAKHYRSFFPLTANVNVEPGGFGGPEFKVLAYNQPPTAEPIYVEPLGSPNNCVTGARGRLDVRFTRQTSVYAWLGRYTSYSEADPGNVTCDTADKYQTNTWDAAIGSELEFDKGSSHAKVWMGARDARHEAPTDRYLSVPGFTDVFYQEGYIRYDIVKHLKGAFSLQFQGVHRHRHEPAIPGSPWTEGENYTALQWAPNISAIFGYEYVARTGCGKDPDAKICHFVNGGLQWKSRSSDKIVSQIFDTVSLFVGQRRGGLRCVSGTCREFPPFEGAKLELVSRF